MTTTDFQNVIDNKADYVSVQEYADLHGVSVMNLLEDIIEGKYQSAICVIHKNEKCVTVFSSAQKKPVDLSESEEYIAAKEYAEMHGLCYGTFVRKLRDGVYTTALQDSSNRWYIRRDEPVDGCREGYITAKEYAKKHSMHYSVMSTLLRDGYFNTAYQDSGKRWYLKEDDVKTKPVIVDPEFEGYIPLKDYAEKHGVNYGTISEDIRLGLYDDVIKRKSYRYIYIKEDAECKTGKRAVRGYVSLRKYAENNEVDITVLRQDIKSGLYKTAKKVGNRWYLKPQERCHSYRGMNSYLTSAEYAKQNNVSHQRLIEDIAAGKYKTVVKRYKHWYIDKNEKCKTLVLKDDHKEEKLIKASEYARLHNVNNKKVLADIKAGLYETAEYIGSKWYLSVDEPCKTLTEDYISLNAYAKLHGVSRIRLREDVMRGLYTTAVKSHDGLRIYINKNEEYKTVDRRKKENKSKESNYISISKYAAIHGVPYQKLFLDVKAGVYQTAELRGSRWYIDEAEPFKSAYKRKR